MAEEFELIAEWANLACPNDSVLLGIGDDAALLRGCRTCGDQPGSRLLAATDLIAEGTHFEIPPATPEQAGRKALAVNLSDIAAMAGRPTSALVSLLLPRTRGAEFARRAMQGLEELAGEFEVALVGGDTNIWDGPFVINVTVIGHPTGDGAILRSGARAGDHLFVTGQLGGSRSGRHLTFLPRVNEALLLRQKVDLHAMIDLSDGLSRDVRHLVASASLGVRIEAGAVPIHPDVPEELARPERLEHALHDGEDFELLFALDPDDGERLLSEPPFAAAITRIGEVTGESGSILLLDEHGEPSELLPRAYEHRFTAP